MRRRADQTAARLLAALLVVPGTLGAQGAVDYDVGSRATVGDWVVECIAKTEAKPGTCQLYQRVLTGDPLITGMVAALAWSHEASELRMQVSLPLGVDLGRPVVLRIDGEAVSAFAWSRCLSTGCLIETLIPPELRTRLLSADTAFFVVMRLNGDEIPIPLSLRGLEEGLARIEVADTTAAKE